MLVEAEARLDHALAAARREADAMSEAARTRIADADAKVDGELAAICARTQTDIARATEERVRAIEQASRDEIAAFEAVRDERADRIARALAEELIALVQAEVPP